MRWGASAIVLSLLLAQPAAGDSLAKTTGVSRHTPEKPTFCIPELESLGEDACYVLPDEPSSTLLIYLHGILPPEPSSAVKTNFQTVVMNGARKAGVVALIPRGKQGLAPPGKPKWWAWPTTGDSYDRHGAELAAKLKRKRAELEAHLGRKFDHVYVAGSSSGAYFVAGLALRGGFAADGYGAMSGGAPFYAPRLSRLSPRPFYVGYGTLDTVRNSCSLLTSQLGRAGWPVKVSEHRTGHGAREVYLDEAFAFWANPAKE
jgi:predicted esterase